MSKWRRKSDRLVVPAKPANKAFERCSNVAELVEERSLAKGNPNQQNSRRTQCPASVNSALDRIRKAGTAARLT